MSRVLVLSTAFLVGLVSLGSEAGNLVVPNGNDGVGGNNNNVFPVNVSQRYQQV